jgi:hypothetical protein
MTTEGVLIVQLPRGSAVERNWAGELPPSIASGRVVLEHFAGEGPPEAGEVVLSVLSPEALRDQQQVCDVIGEAPDEGGPLVVIVEAAEYLREDELAAVLDAADRTSRPVILRVLANA